jgi:hypothetical protein
MCKGLCNQQWLVFYIWMHVESCLVCMVMSRKLSLLSISNSEVKVSFGWILLQSVSIWLTPVSVLL